MSVDKAKRLRGMLGFAMKAGDLIIGTELVCLAMAKEKPPKLVLVSCSASDATKKKITTKGAYYGIPVEEIEIEQEELGHLLGKTTTPAALAVTDSRFAEEIDKANKAL